MKRLLLSIAAFAFASASLPALAQMTPGTVKLLSKNTQLVDAASGDAFVEITNEQSAKFLIIGPETLQGDLRVNVAANETQGPPALLVVLAAGKEVARYKLTPRAGADTWRGRVDVRPGVPVGFYAQIDAGPHAYEFRVQGAPRGAALNLVLKSKAKRPLAANAPVIPSRPAVAAPTPAATPRNGGGTVATPVATPAVVSTPKPLEALRATGPRADQIRKTRRTYEATVKVGYAMPRHEEFDGTAFLGGEARWAFGRAKSIALGVEAGQLAFSAILPDDPSRAEPTSAVDVQLVPVAVQAVWLPSLDGRFQPYVAAGPAAAFASSVRRFAQRGSVSESVVGFGGQLAGGVQYDISGSELEEGGSKLFLEVKGNYMDIPFEEHAFTDWSTVQILGGVALKF